MTAHTESQATDKSLIRDVIDAQPEDASYEEIMRELAFTRMLERGLADARAGRSLDHDEAMRKIRSWRN
jgi:predicted transcriptional regulator